MLPVVGVKTTTGLALVAGSALVSILPSENCCPPCSHDSEVLNFGKEIDPVTGQEVEIPDFATYGLI